MTIARYYVQRLTGSSSNDDLIITSSLSKTWLMVRGADKGGKQLTQIKLKAGAKGTAVLSVTLALAGSRYEIIIGDQTSKSDDPTLKAGGQDPKANQNIQLDFSGGCFRSMDEDPPPPPYLDWSFEAPLALP